MTLTADSDGSLYFFRQKFGGMAGLELLKQAHGPAEQEHGQNDNNSGAVASVIGLQADVRNKRNGSKDKQDNAEGIDKCSFEVVQKRILHRITNLITAVFIPHLKDLGFIQPVLRQMKNLINRGNILQSILFQSFMR